MRGTHIVVVFYNLRRNSAKVIVFSTSEREEEGV